MLRRQRLHGQAGRAQEKSGKLSGTAVAAGIKASNRWPDVHQPSDERRRSANQADGLHKLARRPAQLGAGFVTFTNPPTALNAIVGNALLGDGAEIHVQRSAGMHRAVVVACTVRDLDLPPHTVLALIIREDDEPEIPGRNSAIHAGGAIVAVTQPEHQAKPATPTQRHPLAVSDALAARGR